MVLGSDILKTNGFTACINNPLITVNKLDIQYDRSTAAVTFNVEGSSSQIQNVTASLTVTAYGKQVYQKAFDPCDNATNVEQLCPGKPCKVDGTCHLVHADLIGCSSRRKFRSQRTSNHSIELC